MNNRDIKLMIKEAIKKKCESENSYFKEIDDMRYVIRCPYCGDSSNPSHAHFYIISDPYSNTNMGYKCFLCEASGVLTQETLSLLGIDDPNLKMYSSILTKTSDRVNSRSYMEGEKIKYYNFKLPIPKSPRKIGYMENRLKRRFNNDELKDLKVVTSIHEFLDLNDIHDYMFSLPEMNLLEANYIGFLSYGNSHLLLRDITGTSSQPWIKYPITKECKSNRVLYSIASSLDPLTTDPVTINLSEGVMDIVSVCYNLGYHNSNTLNMCVCGRYYEKILLLLLDLGFCGSNVTVNIFADNDYEFNKKAKNPTTIEYFRHLFRYYKYLYKEINIYYNTIRKDCGYPKDEIKLKMYRL